jgi:benzoylformate decarboxylase
VSEERGPGAPLPSALALAFGCRAPRVATPAELEQTFDDVVPELAGRDEPLVLEIAVAPDESFEP